MDDCKKIPSHDATAKCGRQLLRQRSLWMKTQESHLRIPKEPRWCLLTVASHSSGQQGQMSGSSLDSSGGCNGRSGPVHSQDYWADGGISLEGVRQGAKTIRLSENEL